MSERKRDKCAYCMKSKTPYRVSNLLQMRPLGERGHGKVEGKVIEKAVNRHLIDDGRGNMIPDHPGVVVPITQLPEGHPAVFYHNQRGFGGRFEILEKQFGMAWCEEEAPPDRDIGRFYRRLHDSWRDTPQGRLIIHGYIRGLLSI